MNRSEGEADVQAIHRYVGAFVGLNAYCQEQPGAFDQLIACAALVGLILWFTRKKLVGSFFKATTRS
jgi:hypothetical protein